MRATTHTMVGLRNTGDSQADMQLFEGPLKDAILWLASQLANTVMAQRIDIVFARNREEIDRGMQNSRTGRSKVDESMQQMLNSLFDSGEFDESAEREDQESSTNHSTHNSTHNSAPRNSSRIEGDDYEPSA